MLKNIKITYPVILFFLIIFSKFPTFNLDYYWDSMIFASQAKFLSIEGFFSQIPYGVMHPPMFLWILATAYKIFGESTFLSHLIVAIFSFIAAYFTYLLGCLIFNKKIGIAASILLTFSPMYFAISGQNLLDIPLTAMTVSTLYFGMKKKILPFLISASILVLIKEPGFLAVLAITFYYFLKKERLTTTFISLIPVVAFLVWTFYAIQSGYLHQGLSSQPLTIMILRAFSNLYQIFIWNYNWVLTFIILFVLFSKKVKISELKNFTPLLFLALFYFALFSFAPLPSLPRYLIPIQPAFFILASFSINRIFKKPWLIFAIILILFISAYRWNWGIKGAIQDPIFSSKILTSAELTSVKNGELSLDYIDAVNVQTKAIGFIFNSYPNSTVIATWPIAHNMTVYVNSGYRQWGKYKITVLEPSRHNLDKADLIIFDSCCIPHEIEDNIKMLSLVKTFDSNGRHVYIYRTD